MKGKRLKTVQKTLLFYKIHFGIEPPFRLLLDGTICNTAYSNHINLAEQIPKLFQADVKIYTTQCALSEVESLQARFGVSRGTSLTILKQFPVIPCHHLLAGDVKDCFSSKYRNNTEDSNRNKFCIGTQDQELRKHARTRGGVPILVLKSRVPHIEPPSERSKAIADKLTTEKALPTHSKKVIAGIKLSRGEERAGENSKKKQKHKGKNPMSCLKKKHKSVPTPSTSTESHSRKRKRHKKKTSEDIISLIKNVSNS